jgi:FlaA1/EpsC-like NDP-sugar epimerase
MILVLFVCIAEVSMARLRNHHFLIGDLLLLPLTVMVSYILRFEGSNFAGYQSSLFIFAVLSTVITPVVFYWAGVYSRFWRYASVEELQRLIGAVTTSSVLIAGGTWVGLFLADVLHLTSDSPVLPRSIPFIFLLLAVPATAFPRLVVRLLPGHTRRSDRASSRRTLIYGAGDAGAMTVRELRQRHFGFDVIGFLDDAPYKRNVHIYGLPVFGDRREIARVVEEHEIEQIIIAMPAVPGKAIREIVQLCEAVGVSTKILPRLDELLSGRANVTQLRDVQIEDLLRRETVQIDTDAISDLLRGKRVLVTGGGGSIGSELCRQVLRCHPAQVIILGHGENSVFDIYHELLPLTKGDRASTVETTLIPVIADIRFPDRLDGVFMEHRPEVVFHAAAHKHVPLMELNPSEVITNNVLGTKYVLDAAIKADVERFVMISTDKAVNPTTVMGAGKRVAELLVHQAARRSGKPFVAVRFGNVLGSRGSVVPTFKRQLAAGGPITVTHPEMERYFMTIPEAVQLVLQAAVLGNGGEVFVLDMGQPVKIVDLARDLIELSGLEVGQDIDIVYTGLRPGEKLYEELFIEGESYGRTKHQMIFTADNAGNLIPPDLNESVTLLVGAARHGDAAAIRTGLRQLVPGFHEAAQPIPAEP